MNINDFDRLFSYDAWANREVLAGLGKNPDPRGLEFIAHILSAETLWLERLRQQPQSSPVWPAASQQACEAQAGKLATQWRDYLASLGDQGLEQIVNYKNTLGEPWNNRVADILMHVIMHSAYHRGQIATTVRASGATPVMTDYIHAVRQGLLE